MSKKNENILNIFSKTTADWFKNTFGEPTQAQEASWRHIAEGKDILLSAPTGTGKTLSAFLVFIDKLNTLAEENKLNDELYLIYISPLKSLAADIRENLQKPLDGINAPISIGIRTGDTTQSKRRAMLKKPPNILITTPESLYLLLTSVSGQKLLKTAKAIILDELHVMIDSKRGAHLMLSLARLDRLCEKPLQRIGLSATIEPLERAAEYLSPRHPVIAAPKMQKAVEIKIISPYSGNYDNIDGNDAGVNHVLWENLAKTVYSYCSGKRSVIAFLEGRAYAEKLAFYVNKYGGDGFARSHHGCLAKEQRFEVEAMLRSGELRLLCATSSMELGIDVGDIDEVFQIGCPATIAGTLQRLGRAGHNPGRTSRMFMFPRTPWEALYCGLTAITAANGGIEPLKPPVNCLDVLAQHLVSMSVAGGYYIDDVMELLPLAYPFKEITRDDVTALLEMLAGDYEHGGEIPARPRVLYDRIHGYVEGDNYSRLLAVSAGGTIPDRGMYNCKTESGVKVGELDEEFVFETRVGDRFMLGSFAWQICEITKDTVTVRGTSAAGARLPFWHNEWRGRGLTTGYAFGEMLRRLNSAHEKDKNLLLVELYNLGLDEAAAKSADYFLKRQYASTGALPDDKTIIIEHFKDDSGNNQVMFHSVFGRQINAPLSILVHAEAERISGYSIGCVDMDDGFLLYPYGGEGLPEKLLYRLNPETAKQALEIILPTSHMFGIIFRYNIARALLAGMRKNGRTPLWLQRIKSAQILDNVLVEKKHPIVRETKRECLEDLWDLKGMEKILAAIFNGEIYVKEIWHNKPSPFSLPCRWQVEANVMYDYSPVTGGVRNKVAEEISKLNGIKPDNDSLSAAAERKRQPENEKELHSLLMIEGDFVAAELIQFSCNVMEWLESLADDDRVLYVEPGLWIAAEHFDVYKNSVISDNSDRDNLLKIIRRLLRYRGAKTAEQIGERYCFPAALVMNILDEFCENGTITEDNGLYYHTEMYDRARKLTIKKRRETVTLPPENFAALLAVRVRIDAPPEHQLENALRCLCGIPFPAEMWESSLLPMRVDNYNPAMLDALLARGEFCWQYANGELLFALTENIEDEIPEISENIKLSETEIEIYSALRKRGAVFTQSLSRIMGGAPLHEPLLSLAEKGLICSDSFQPVRHVLQKNEIEKASLKKKIAARTMLLTSGRWDIVRLGNNRKAEEYLSESALLYPVISRETISGISWSRALEILRKAEYTGQVRRGYYIKGLSGAQFIETEQYDDICFALKNPPADIIWLPAVDPNQVWGKILPHTENRQFMNVKGTAVALCGGIPVAVFENYGKTLRIFDNKRLEKILCLFAEDFSKGRIMSGRNVITVKKYPEEAAPAMKKAGFSQQMLDFVLYKR